MSYKSERIVELGNKGLKPTMIALRLGVTLPYVYRFVKGKQIQRKWTLKDIEYMMKAREESIPFSAIGKALNRTTEQCVTRYWYYKDKKRRTGTYGKIERIL